MESVWRGIPGETAARLLDWYDSGHRSLPWRDDPTPYHVWISEIMLQQTRVETVKPYYLRFIEALPDPAALAAAPEPLLLKLWEGLGYYRRVYSLQAAARLVVRQYGGEIPQNPAQLRALPGIGDYTAGAIASIAYGRPVPAVDGNVLRVTARLTGDFRDVTKAQVRHEYTAALGAIYPKDRCGDFTQSLMELGAVVCLPGGRARCADCPLETLCLARARNCVDELPVRPAKKPREIRELTVFLLWQGKKLAVRRRGPEGLLARLWELPNAPGALSPREARRYLEGLGVLPEELREAEPARHIFTHVEWRMKAYTAECGGPGRDLKWVSPAQMQKEVALPSAFRHWELNS